MAASDRQMLDSLSRMPFVDSAELAGILGEPHATVHRALIGLLAEGIVGRVSHGTAHLPSSQRYYLTAQGIREAAELLGFATPSDFVRAYPVSREWLALLIRRMDAVAAVYRLAASLSPGIDGLRSHVEFHRRGRFDATITLHDGRSFGVVRQGLALRRRSLYDRLRAIAGYDYTRRPEATLILMPSDGVTSESASVLDFVKSGPQRGTRTPSERQLNRQFPGSSTSQHNRSIELTLAEVIVQADSITPYSRVVTILSQEKLGRHFPAGKKPGARHTIRA